MTKLTPHEFKLDWPIPINPFLLLGGQGAKGAAWGLAWRKQCESAAAGITVIE